MGLLDTLGSVSNALRVTQASIQVVSENVSNSQNDAYSKRAAVVTDAGSTGTISLAGIKRAVDDGLARENLDQSSLAAGDAALNELYQRLGDVTGTSGTSPALSSTFQKFQDAWKSFETTPDDSVARQSLVTAAQGFVQSLQSVAAGVETLATSAKAEIGDSVSTLNADLASIDQLNKSLITAKATNRPAPELEDQRDAKIAEIAKLTAIRTVARPDGSVAVLTPGGLSLVDTGVTSYSWDGTNITQTGSAGSVNTSFAGGSIGATLGFLAADANSVASSNPRLGALQKLRDQLDDVAGHFYDSAAPGSFQTAYDTASTGTGELASAFFTTTDGSARANRFTLSVDPGLVAGTSQVKAAAATGIVGVLSTTDQATSAGGLAVSGKSYGGLVGSILSQSSNAASTVSATATTSAATSDALKSRLKSQTGVNVDDELANLIALQNSYSAIARIVQATNDMLQKLEQIGT